MYEDRNMVMVDSLEKICPAFVKELRDEWYRLRYDPSLNGVSENDYVMMHFEDRLREKEESFKEADMADRLDKTAARFRIKKNPDLWKEHYSTGFSMLDEVLGGGFTAGVHYIGAISSLGKSTLALQMADAMASKGLPVIYISLEMPRVDMAAKLISMYTYLGSQEDTRLAKTSSALVSQKVSENLSDKEWAVVEAAAARVEEHGKTLTILENQINPYTVDDIADYIHTYIHSYLEKPVVYIDYLQILSPPKRLKGCSDKQAVDYTVAKLRAISAVHGIPVIVISSFNRENYKTRANFQAFKDSGNIEYSGDTLIGLQLKGVGDPDFDADKAKARYPRDIEMMILKQRNGPAGCSIKFNYYTRFNYFQQEEWITAPYGTEKIFPKYNGIKEGRQFTMSDYREDTRTTEVV